MLLFEKRSRSRAGSVPRQRRRVPLVVALLVALLLTITGTPPATASAADEFTITDVTLDEPDLGLARFDFIVELKGPTAAAGNASAKYSTVSVGSEIKAGAEGTDCTQTPPVDYISKIDETVTIGPATPRATIQILVCGDLELERDEAFDVVIDGATASGGSCSEVAGNTAQVADCTGRGTIRNDETGISLADVSQDEGDTGTTAFTFTATVAGPFHPGVTSYTAKYETFAGGTATADSPPAATPPTPPSCGPRPASDYLPASGDITITRPATTATFTVTVCGDATVESDETFNVRLFNPTNAACTDCEAVATIQDDESPKFIVEDLSANEGNTGTSDYSFTVTITKAPPAGSNPSANYTTENGTATGGSGTCDAGEDYLTKTGPINFTSTGPLSQEVVVQACGDTLGEPNETFNLRLTNVTNARPCTAAGAKCVGQGTLVNDDGPPPAASVANISVTEGNTGTSPASEGTFTVKLSVAAGQPVSVRYSTEDSTAKGAAVTGTPGTPDYTPSSGTLSFSATETEKTVTVPVVGDVVDEADETFLLKLSSPRDIALSNDTATATIRDDDESPLLNVGNVSVTEGNSGTSNADFALTLSAASGREVTVGYATSDGTAVAEGDYRSTSGTATFAPGSKTTKVSVPVVGDTSVEPDETFSLKLAGAAGATIVDGEGVATVVNDDSAAATSGTSGTTATKGRNGYWIVAKDGGIFAYGEAVFRGSMGGKPLNQPIVGMAESRSGNGYFLVASDGGVFAFGDAVFRGSMGGKRLNKPIVGMASTPSGNGYFLVASDGGIFAFGDAVFRGSMGGKPLNQPIVALGTTPSGRGYFLVASDGGLFAFGDAVFRGSMGGKRLNKPISGMASSKTGNGYFLVASDGGMFAFGDAVFRGSAADLRLAQPIVGMDRTPTGNGYHLVASDGGVFAYGDAVFRGSAGNLRLAQPVTGIVALDPA